MVNPLDYIQPLGAYTDQLSNQPVEESGVWDTLTSTMKVGFAGAVYNSWEKPDFQEDPDFDILADERFADGGLHQSTASGALWIASLFLP